MLNSEQMLPRRVRTMRQMQDLLNAEDLILAEIERIIEDMYRKASLIKEELVNEEWLERHLLELTGSKNQVTGDSDHLMVNVQFEVSEQEDLNREVIRAFLHKWLPAHLQYQLQYLLEYTFAHKERFFLEAIIIQLQAAFFKVRTLDGTWLLDGAYCLDAVRKTDDCGIGYGMGETGHNECMTWEILQQIGTWIKEWYTGIGLAAGGGQIESRPLTHLNRLDMDTGMVRTSEGYQTGVILKQDYWVLDGSYLLNGIRGLNATKTEEDL